MSQLNANIPYLECYLRKEYTGLEQDVYGYIFGVKSMINRPLHFHFLSSIGALFWNLPISAFYHDSSYEKMDKGGEEYRLSLLQTWNCQSNDIAVTTFAFLQYKTIDVYFRDGIWRKGCYLFTIDDYEGDLNYLNVGYSNDQDSKCYHFIQLENGNYCIHPNNLLRVHDPNFVVPYDKDSPPRIKMQNEHMTCEDIDRSYGNSPYYFYTFDNK